jgi:GDP-L-fucose synthase
MNGDTHFPCWGDGTPEREFLYVDDMAEASVFVMNLSKEIYDSCTKPMQSYLNVGFGSDISIAELSKTVGSVVSYQGKISFDSSQPDGSPRKLIDSSRIIELGWSPKMRLIEGLEHAYADFLLRHQDV